VRDNCLARTCNIGAYKLGQGLHILRVSHDLQTFTRGNKSLKDHCPHMGQLEVWASFYNFNFHCDFLRLFLGSAKIYKLCEDKIYFLNWILRRKLCYPKQKYELVRVSISTIENFQKMIEFFFLME
jgi:hypothetical protein